MSWLMSLAVVGVIISLCGSNLTLSPHQEVDAENVPSDRTFIMTDPINYVGLQLADKMNEAGNFFYSPLGISMSLGMAYLGARGATAQQMRRALGYDQYNISFEQVHKEIRRICEDVVPLVTDPNYKFVVANALFSQRGSNLDANYVESLQTEYHATTQSLDFEDQSQASKIINDWVNNETSGAIKSLVSSPLPPDTSLFLANAVRFKGTWQTKFQPDLTQDSYFYVSERERDVVVPTMHLVRSVFPYFKDDIIGYKFMELPYKGERIVMLLALPLQFNQTANLRMTPELMTRILYNMTDTELQIVALPKFKIEYEKQLNEPLKSLGITHAFEPNSADFSGMKSSGASIYLSDVTHKGVIETNEAGSEAAAVTGLLFVPLSAREVDDFRANHPFLFYIIDKQTGTILFSGRLADPR